VAEAEEVEPSEQQTLSINSVDSALREGPVGVAGVEDGGGRSDVSDFPRGLTEDGMAELVRLLAEERSRLLRRIGRELTLQWMALVDADGPEAFTWDRVRKAFKAIQTKERRDIRAEERAKLRTKDVEERQQARAARALLARRAKYRWIGGAALTAGGSTTVAVMAVPGNTWAKVALVLISVAGAVISRPPHPEDS
jgi:hypothetical protein